MYTWNQLGIVELTNLFLYGEITQPADLSSESRIREADAIKPISMDAVSFMATGPGRFANGAQIKVVDMFMSGEIGVNSGVRQELNIDEATALTGEENSDRHVYLASNFADEQDEQDEQDDHALRTYLYQTESFRLAQDVTFVIEPDGRRYILDYAIRSGSMIPDTNVGGNIAAISEVSDDQEKTIFYAGVQAGSRLSGA